MVRLNRAVAVTSLGYELDRLTSQLHEPEVDARASPFEPGQSGLTAGVMSLTVHPLTRAAGAAAQMPQQQASQRAWARSRRKRPAVRTTSATTTAPSASTANANWSGVNTYLSFQATGW